MATLPITENVNISVESYTKFASHRPTNHILLIQNPTAVPDETPPTITDITPPASTVLELTQSVSFSVTDAGNGTFARIIIAVAYTNSVEELVYDGSAFVGLYAATSSISAITDGFRFTILRSGGWLTAPTFRAFPIDSSGNDGT